MYDGLAWSCSHPQLHFEWVMAWRDMLPIHHYVNMLDKLFFPKMATGMMSVYLLSHLLLFVKVLVFASELILKWVFLHRQNNVWTIAETDPSKDNRSTIADKMEYGC